MDLSDVKVTTNETGANREVLAFYTEMPFDYRGDAAKHAASIRTTNPIDSYPVLKPLLKPKKSLNPFAQRQRTNVLEVGCGAGWLSNAIAHYYSASVQAIDFNPVAIERAKEISRILGTNVEFDVADLFLYQPETPAEVSISLGVLHHTNDCLGAVRRMFDDFTVPGGHSFIGLYHAYGRKPFLDHFSSLQSKGFSEDALLEEYRNLDSRFKDETHLVSWFRDQVLHPHETQHSLKELLPVMADCGMELKATSINRFQPIDSVEALLAQEIEMEKLARERLDAGAYFPGFFVILAKKT